MLLAVFPTYVSEITQSVRFRMMVSWERALKVCLYFLGEVKMILLSESGR